MGVSVAPQKFLSYIIIHASLKRMCGKCMGIPYWPQTSLVQIPSLPLDMFNLVQPGSHCTTPPRTYLCRQSKIKVQTFTVWLSALLVM